MLQYLINNLNMSQDHSSTAVPFQTQSVQSILLLHTTYRGQFLVRLPLITNNFPASKAANRNDHDDEKRRVVDNILIYFSMFKSILYKMLLLTITFLITEIHYEYIHIIICIYFIYSLLFILFILFLNRKLGLDTHSIELLKKQFTHIRHIDL